MTTHLAVDKAGRIVIPKPVREALRLGPGDTLEMDSTGEVITLRPVRQTVPLQKKRGIWVYGTGRRTDAATVDAVLADVREERSRDLLR